MPLASAKPIAAGVPDSGTGMTRSASAGCSAASRRPAATRVACTPRPEIVVSGRARETYSNRRPLGWAAAAVRTRRTAGKSHGRRAERGRVADEQRGEHLGVGRRLDAGAARPLAPGQAPEQAGQLAGVDQVPVVAERQADRAGGAERRL